MEKIRLKDVICRHNLPVTGLYGKTVHVIVFFDPRDKETYIWKTSCCGLEYDEGKTYTIIAEYKGNCVLSRVKDITSQEEKSEQPDAPKVNALDILLPNTDKHLTFNEKYDIIYRNERRNLYVREDKRIFTI